VEDIRGVSSTGVLRTLQDRGLVEAVARAEGLGRPLLYGTTRHFLEHFGFRSLEDLPRPDELPVVLRARVVASPAADAGDVKQPDEAAAGASAGAEADAPLPMPDGLLTAAPSAEGGAAATPSPPEPEPGGP